VIGSSEEYGLISPEDLPIGEDTPLRPLSAYAVSKVAQDLLGLQYHLTHNLHVVRVRPFNHIGPRQRIGFVAPDIASQIAATEFGQSPPIIEVGNLAARRDFSDVRDVVQALGEEKINLFLKESGAPGQFDAKRVIAMMESGQGNPKQMASMMKQMPRPKKDEKGADPEEQALLDYSDKVLGGKGFVEWTAYDHPTLGAVEIGGFAPYIHSSPPYEIVDSLLELQVPWITELADKLPELKIFEAKVTPRGAGIYQLEVWTENRSFLPFPTAMGRRNNQPAPAVLVIEGDVEILEGSMRTPLNSVAGHSRVKNSWLVKADKSADLEIRLTSK